MTKGVQLVAVLAVCLCAPAPTPAQGKDARPLNTEQATLYFAGPHCVPALADKTAALDKDAYRRDTELARRIAVNVERTIKAEEPKWRLHKGVSLGHIFTQSWRSSDGSSLELEIYVCESPEGASRKLLQRGVLPVAISQKLEDFGEEARSFSHPYVTWVGVRRGRLVASVGGPGRAMATTKRFAQYALEQLEAQ